MSLRNLFWDGLNWLFPPHCVCCGKEGKAVCDDCLSGMRPVGERICPKCGKPLGKGRQCRLCARSDFRFQASRAPFLYEGAAAAMIKALKFSGCRNFAPVLADLMADLWQELQWTSDLIVPVPLSRRRRALRGFNQSELIGARFSGRTGIPMDPNALMKVRHTKDQVGLNAEERRKNLLGSFAAEENLVRGKRVLLLDDVMTTGSTFAECTSALLAAGADSVNCISAATTAAGTGT